jgi:hypothetical protein
MSSVIATSKDIIRTALSITLDTLRTLIDSVFISWRAHEYCDAVGVPPTEGAREWSSTVSDLQARMEATTDPAQYAQITKDALVLLRAINGALSKTPGTGSPDPADTLYRALVPILMAVLANPRSGRVSGGFGRGLYIILAMLWLVDQRIQDSYPQGLMEQRFYAVLRDLAVRAHWIEDKKGSQQDATVDWPPILTDVVAALFLILFVFVLDTKERFKFEDWPERSRRWSYYWYGFDHPPIAGFEQAQTLAELAFTIVLAPKAHDFTVDRFDTIEPQRPPEPQKLAQITLVPVPKSIDPNGKGELFIQIEAFSQIETDIGGGWKFKMGETPSFGALISTSNITPIGDVGFQFEISREWPDQPSTSDDSSLSFRATQIGIGAQVDLEDLGGWIRIEKGELAISGGHWLNDYVPKLRFTFDVQATAAIRDGIQFKGGAGGDVLIPVNQRIPFFIGALTVQAIRVHTFMGSDGGSTGLSLQGTVNVSAELFGVLTVQVSGLGASYDVGTAPQGDGNVGGVMKHGWNPVLPTGAGLSISAWKITGGGALFYDSAKDLLSGAIELDVAGAFSVKGTGFYQRPTGSAPKSWLALVTLEIPCDFPAVALEGFGLLYGSDRGTSTNAFLAAIGNGNLSALLFGSDLIKNAPAFIASLETLLPAQQGISVLGFLANFVAASGMITLSVGVILEYSATAIIRTYVIGRLVAVCPPPKAGVKLDPKKVPIYIQADGVALWDSATDTLDLRIQLNNSRIWGGELTGGASIYHGPKRSDVPINGTYVSVGGFHPDYTPPASLYVPARLSLVVSKGDHLKIQVTAYVAYTPCSIQAGIGGLLEAHLYGFGIRGTFNIDMLFGFDGNFSVGASASVELLLGSETLAAVSFKGKLVGTGPTVLSGKVEVQFLFWTLSKSGSVQLTDGDSENPPQPDVAAALATAVGDSRNWENSGAPGLTLSDRQRDGVWLSPNAPLRFRQALVPLNIPIQRFGAAKLTAAQTLRIESVKAGTTTLSSPPIQNDFALGMFLDLSQEEMLSGQGFESRDAGVEISRSFDALLVITTQDDFEEIMLDPKARPENTKPIILSTVILQMTTMFTTVNPAPTPVEVRRERFTIVDSALKPQSASITMFEARSSLKPGWRVVPEAEVVS